MKTMLVGINARYIHVNAALYSLRASAAAYAKRLDGPAGELVLREFTVNQGAEAIYYSILREQPRAVAFSVYLWNVRLVRDLCRDLRRACPDCLLILGGPEVSWGTEHAEFAAEDFDYVIEGEGERPFYGLLASLQQPGFRPPEEWRFRIEGKRVTAAPPETLDELPFLYEEDDGRFRNRILYYEASRGCPFSCSYCLSAPEKGVRLRSLDLVLQELSVLVSRKTPLIKFVDRTFNCSPGRSLAILRWIRQLPEEEKTCFHFEIEAGVLTPELIEELTALPRGRVQAEIGIQSTSARTLEACRRNPSLETVFANIRRLTEAGNIRVHVDLIAGLPYESYERFLRSLEEALALGAHQLQLGFLKRLQGTPLAAEAERYGYAFSPHPPYEVLRNDFIGPGELRQLKKIEDVLERYYNSGRFMLFLGELRRQYENAVALWQELADFYESRDLIFASLGAADTFRAAVDFVWQKELPEPERRRLLEALLLDYYAFTSADRLPEGLEELGRRPEGSRETATALLRSVGDRSRRCMVRFLQGRPYICDYTTRDPVTARYPLWPAAGTDETPRFV